MLLQKDKNKGKRKKESNRNCKPQPSLHANFTR